MVEQSQAGDKVNQQLLEELNMSGKIHMITAGLRDKFSLRFCISQEGLTDAAIIEDWRLIQEFASKILSNSASQISGRSNSN